VITNFKLEHVGVAVPDLSASIASYQKLFGYRVLSGPFNDPIQKVTVCFLGAGAGNEIEIELIAPLQEDSPVKRLLAKGGGAYHVCYGVPDIEKALAEARADGCLVVSGPVPAVAYGGRKIAWLYTPSRQLFEVVERG